ncbi:copper homeostasis protein CutC [Solitalea longa]|uniref:PF03932 family protein CutC n=1 Tax=Solitalea longa TaxID=2079460 RepID=A0A2S5A8S7_9SPHI|nr:copper homeostasis protein CutC [Solitalea longa]POY39000.1 copper homeostasis protein CutC [Solitalea longa]
MNTIIEPTLEICCYSAESVAEAAKGGAHRVELCDSMQDGGTTPSMGTIAMARKVKDIKLYVIIRPRGGDFCYNPTEFEVMKYDITEAKRLGADGVVIGILNADGSIDVDRTKQLVDLAQPLDVTFHRAFDMSNNPVESLEAIYSCGIKRILTSGAYNTAPEGVSVLQSLSEQAGNRIAIMAGSGVNAGNMEQLFKAGIRHFHSSATKFVNTEMQYRNPNIKMGKEGQLSEFEKPIVDVEKVKAMKDKLDDLSNIKISR